jgi:hypothetical protein
MLYRSVRTLLFYNNFNEKLAVWFAEIVQSFTVVEHPAFKEMLAAYSLNLIVPSAYKEKFIQKYLSPNRRRISVKLFFGCGSHKNFTSNRMNYSDQNISR